MLCCGSPTEEPIEATALLTQPTSALPEPVRHDHTLPDGRNLSYYTFRCDASSTSSRSEPKRSDDDDYPVLYLHGFPGAGIEAEICASEVAKRGCRLFAPDRPGFGHSDPLPDESDVDRRIRLVVDDAWSFVRHSGWDRFSVVSFSGGGVYALAMIESYLDSRCRYVTSSCRSGTTGIAAPDPPPPKLEAVSIVGGVCCSAGTEGMMSSVRTFHSLASLRRTNLWARTTLRAGMAASRFLLYALPQRVNLCVFKTFNKLQFPPADREVVDADSGVFARHMVKVMKYALRQGTGPCISEAEVEFRDHRGWKFEERLREHYAQYSRDCCYCGSESTALECEPPCVAIFHGLLDRHAPPPHGEYLHRQVLGGMSDFVTYDNAAHFSVFVGKMEDYVGFISRHISAT